MFTFNDLKLLKIVGKTIEDKDTGFLYLVVSLTDKGVFFGNGNFVTFKRLENYILHT